MPSVQPSDPPPKPSAALPEGLPFGTRGRIHRSQTVGRVIDALYEAYHIDGSFERVLATLFADVSASLAPLTATSGETVALQAAPARLRARARAHLAGWPLPASGDQDLIAAYKSWRLCKERVRPRLSWAGTRFLGLAEQEGHEHASDVEAKAAGYLRRVPPAMRTENVWQTAGRRLALAVLGVRWEQIATRDEARPDTIATQVKRNAAAMGLTLPVQRTGRPAL